VNFVKDNPIPNIKGIKKATKKATSVGKTKIGKYFLVVFCIASLLLK